ncbi:hypothetical protein CTEN210_01034 [Chaetoceros tenuissimus]|uniref:Thioredoxin domain-containing protein n=1 Tax=Chaetoceros tenuissimus TaxID=426638 RepID=A0AAD3CG89_9STRA|nr:hypothetical protein CTEN210_01034 [Chaetoceros tenuissimus]
MAPIAALYEDSSAVIQYEKTSEFKAAVSKKGLTMVQFYAPWCGHCKQFSPVYQQIAAMFEGIVDFVAVDTDGPLKRLMGEYNVQGFPTMKLFVDGNIENIETRDPNELVNLLLKRMNDVIQQRADDIMAGGNKDSAGGGSSSSSGSRGNSRHKAKGVMELTSQTFDEHVYQNPNVVAVAFIAPWCGYCKQLLPEWEIAAQKLKKQGANLYTVDATQEEQLASQFQVQGFPTIKLFPGGQKSFRDARDFEGGRQQEQIVQYVLQEVDRSGVPKQIAQMTSSTVFEETCVDEDGSTSTICVIVALPHILETGAEGRNKYKDLIMDASKSVRGMSFEFLWMEGYSQPKLEEALEMSFGYPAVAAISFNKGVYAIHRSSFSEANIRKFLLGITSGKVPTYKLKDGAVPEIVSVEEWDGQDGEVFEEDLSWMDDDEDFGNDEF